MTGSMGKGNGRILKMKTSSFTLVAEKRLPEEETATARVPETAKVAGRKNATFAGRRGEVSSYVKLN